jgi:hypothetical protein
VAATRGASQPGCAIRSSASVALVLAFVWNAAAAQTTDDRLRALERQVGELQKRVEVLEGHPAPSMPIANDCPGWDRLRMSLTQAEVRALLGDPAKVDATPLQITWRYACGKAYFDADTKRFVGYER